MERDICLDSTHAQTTLLQYLGRAIGQVFYAPDTVIQSISVWRSANPAPYFPYLILYVTQVDSTGEPEYLNVLRTGPIVLPDQQNDGVHPGRINFVLDPPLALPGRGRYFFAVKDYYCLEAILLLADSTNGYSEGRAWKTSPIYDCSIMGPPRELPPMLDLIFRVTFCADTTTGTKRSSWGQVKLRYR